MGLLGEHMFQMFACPRRRDGSYCPAGFGARPRRSLAPDDDPIPQRGPTPGSTPNRRRFVAVGAISGTPCRSQIVAGRSGALGLASAVGFMIQRK